MFKKKRLKDYFNENDLRDFFSTSLDDFFSDGGGGGDSNSSSVTKSIRLLYAIKTAKIAKTKNPYAIKTAENAKVNNNYAIHNQFFNAGIGAFYRIGYEQIPPKVIILKGFND